MLGDGTSVHTFRQAGIALMGVDWTRCEIEQAIHKSVCELGGDQCRALNHGLVVHTGGSPLFVECREGLDYDDFETTTGYHESEPAAVAPCTIPKWSSGQPLDLNHLAAEVNAMNRNWWLDVNTGEPIERNRAELLCLIHSEISECLEGVRKGMMDDKLPHRSAETVELADALIRILDYAGGFGLDLQGAFEEKMAYNATRSDHAHEHRRAEGGKRF